MTEAHLMIETWCRLPGTMHQISGIRDSMWLRPVYTDEVLQCFCQQMDSDKVELNGWKTTRETQMTPDGWPWNHLRALSLLRESGRLTKLEATKATGNLKFELALQDHATNDYTHFDKDILAEMSLWYYDSHTEIPPS